MNAAKETLADQIANILPAGPGLDPDVETDDTTAAKVVDFVSEDQEDDEELLSKFRKQNIDLLGDVDERYAGRKSSRKQLKEFESESEDESSEGSVHGESEDENEDNNDLDGESAETSEDEDKTIEDTNGDESDGDLEGETELASDADGETDNFKHVKGMDASTQMQKGICVRNQMNIWENLLEMRIQIQKCLATANKMPQKEVYNEMRNFSQDYVKKSSEAKKSVSLLLDKLLLLQNLSLRRYPETKTLMSSKTKETSDNDNEEIPSDTEDESSEDGEQDEGEKPSKKPRLINEYEKEINDNHNRYSSYRNSVIQKWHEKTRLAVLKQNTTPHSIINHIEHTLSNRTKLIKRTQLKRSNYEILGEDKKEDTDADTTKPNEEYNTEIYDDDDFYHQLLRELIEVKSADLTDPVQLGRQWIQLQNLRSKMKRKIDTRATKGRKIRYAVHTKLVNFMAPIELNSWTDEAKTELYNSLFGKRQVVTS